MRILVVDVAAEIGGALTVFEQFRQEFRSDINNQYICLLSRPRYEDEDNIRYLNFEWVKKSFFHRVYFDYFYIRKIISKVKPDKVLSLQNNAVNAGKIKQDVYFHNALFITSSQYTIAQSFKLWEYQNIISRIVKASFRRASGIIVQADWIKETLAKKWSVDPDLISVKRPYNLQTCCSGGKNKSLSLFYPAGYSLYKNYGVLMDACISVWEQRGSDCGLTLHLLGNKVNLSALIGGKTTSATFPIFYHGRLTKQEMYEMYRSCSLVFPSLVETVGLPLVECASVGSYIMAADLDYAREALSGYENCAFFAPDRSDNLSALILELIDGGANE